MEPNKILIVGHDETKAPLRAVKEALKKVGIIASCYFDDEMERAQEHLSDVSFVLIGLSRAGREPSSVQHAREKGLFDKIANMQHRLPCGVVRDCDGHISAQYLVKHGGLIRIVCTDGPDGQRAPLDLFSNFRQLWIDDSVKFADEIAEGIRAFLHVTPVTV